MKKIDVNALLRAIIFGFFAIAIFYMGLTGSLAFVLHPKMFKFTYFAAVIFLLISISMLGRIKKEGSKKVDLRILVFMMPILFMFSNIQPLKGEALKNMSYDVLNNSNRIAKANLNNGKAQEQKSELSPSTDVLNHDGDSESTLTENGKRNDLKEDNLEKREFEKKELEKTNSEKTNRTEDDRDAQKPKNPNTPSDEDALNDQNNNDDKNIKNKAGDKENEGDQNNDEVTKSQGRFVAQDHNVENNSSIIIDTNISSGDEPLYLPSVSETKGKNYDIEKFLDDMLEAYSFTGDGSNKFDHQEFEVVGFVYRDDYFDSNRFMVGRILLTCCISDAQQIGVLVEGTEDYTQKFQDDSWVKVRGKLFWQQLHNPNTKEDIKVLTLKPTKIEQIEDIAYPYVYFE